MQNTTQQLNAAQALRDIAVRYRQHIADPDLAVGDLAPLRELDTMMRDAVEQALSQASDEPVQVPQLQGLIGKIAELNQQLLQKVEQGRQDIAGQLGKLGSAHRGARAYADNARL